MDGAAAVVERIEEDMRRRAAERAGAARLARFARAQVALVRAIPGAPLGGQSLAPLYQERDAALAALTEEDLAE